MRFYSRLVNSDLANGSGTRLTDLSVRGEQARHRRPTQIEGSTSCAFGAGGTSNAGMKSEGHLKQMREMESAIAAERDGT